MNNCNNENIDNNLIDAIINNYIRNNITQFIPLLSDNDNIIINKIIANSIDNYINNNIHIIIDSIFDYFENFLNIKLNLNNLDNIK